jgi:hypothetical protein
VDDRLWPAVEYAMRLELLVLVLLALTPEEDLKTGVGVWFGSGLRDIFSLTMAESHSL